MLLLGQFLHTEGFLVGVNVVEHVRVLIAAEPLVLPVESQCLIRLEQLAQGFLVDVNGVDPAATTRLRLLFDGALHGQDWHFVVGVGHVSVGLGQGVQGWHWVDLCDTCQLSRL